MRYIYQLLKLSCLGTLSTWCTKPGWKHCMPLCIEPSLEMIMAFRGISDFLLIRHPPLFFLHTNSHSHSLPSFSLYDIQAVAVLTVTDKIGQLRHLGEQFLACKACQNFTFRWRRVSRLSSVFSSSEIELDRLLVSGKEGKRKQMTMRDILRCWI